MGVILGRGSLLFTRSFLGLGGDLVGLGLAPFRPGAGSSFSEQCWLLELPLGPPIRSFPFNGQTFIEHLLCAVDGKISPTGRACTVAGNPPIVCLGHSGLTSVFIEPLGVWPCGLKIPLPD